MTLDVASQPRRLQPQRSPIRPSEVPSRNERSDVSACWSGFSNMDVRAAPGAKLRATARPVMICLRLVSLARLVGRSTERVRT